MEHLRAQQQDHVGALGYVHELQRLEQAALWMLPANQRLDPHRSAGLEVDDRLIVQAQLSRGDAAGQVVGESQPAMHHPDHFGGRKGRLDLPSCLGHRGGLGGPRGCGDGGGRSGDVGASCSPIRVAASTAAVAAAAATAATLKATLAAAAAVALTVTSWPPATPPISTATTQGAVWTAIGGEANVSAAAAAAARHSSGSDGAGLGGRLHRSRRGHVNCRLSRDGRFGGYLSGGGGASKAGGGLLPALPEQHCQRSHRPTIRQS